MKTIKINKEELERIIAEMIQTVLTTEEVLMSDSTRTRLIGKYKNMEIQLKVTSDSNEFLENNAATVYICDD